MKNTNIVVLGTGQLGEAFKRLTNFAVVGRDVFDWDAPTATQQFQELVECYEPKVVINCIGLSDTRWCENPNNYEKLIHVNGALPKFLSWICKQCDVKLVHISTGCLYDIPDRPQRETDFLVAHCRYTLAKWMGECGCNLDRDLVIRARLYFSPTYDKNNLLVKLPTFKKYTNVLDSITSVDTIVEAVIALLRNDVVGPVNVSCDGYASMKQIADHLKFGIGRGIIDPVELRNDNGLYLVNSVMDISKLKRYYEPLTWQDDVTRCWEKLNEGNTLSKSIH